MGVMNFTKRALSNLFSKPATRNYPNKSKEFFEGSRGHVVFDSEDCIYCGICARKCPADAIEINRAEKTWSIVRARCVQCNSCVEVCPKACITMHPEYTPVMCEKETEVCHARVADNEADN